MSKYRYKVDGSYTYSEGALPINVSVDEDDDVYAQPLGDLISVPTPGTWSVSVSGDDITSTNTPYAHPIKTVSVSGNDVTVEIV